MPLSEILLFEQLPYGAVAVYDKDESVPLYYWDQGQVNKQDDNRRHWAQFQKDGVDPGTIVVDLLKAVVQDRGNDPAMSIHPYAIVRHPDTPNPIIHPRDFTHHSMPLNCLYMVVDPEMLGRRVFSERSGEWAYFIYNPDGVRAVDMDLALVYAVLSC